MSFPSEIGISFYGGEDKKRVEILRKVKDSRDPYAIASALLDLANDLNSAWRKSDVGCGDKEWLLFSREIPRP